MWPDHCVAGTRGAELVDGLPRDRLTAVFRKGQDPRVDSYSGFFDNGRRGDTGLAAWLQGRGVRRLVVVGVATDYCVQYTARDAAALGFAVELWLPGCRGVELQTGDVARALAGHPAVLLADEPTGNLDSKNGDAVIELLQELHRGGATIVMVTHDPRFARHAARTVHLFDGRIVSAEEMVQR
jgi:hypothetical protein